MKDTKVFPKKKKKKSNNMVENDTKLDNIDNIDINKIVVSHKVSFGKKDFKYFIDYKDAKKIDLYAYYFQK